MADPSLTPPPTVTPPRNGILRALPLANAVLIATALYSFGWLVFVILSHKPQLYLKVGPAAMTLGAMIVLTLRPTIRMFAMAVLVGTAAGIYASELIALGLMDPDRSYRDAMRTAAARDGVPYDGRNKIDVIQNLRSRHIQAYPPFYPNSTLDSPLQIDGAPAIPLGSLARAVTVCCNEGGQYLIYPTDEHGFPNPPGLWNRSPIDIALIGASVATGECVPPAASIASSLRTRYPNTITLGAGGNGPLLELASMREYLPALKPHRVLWIFSESHTPPYLSRESRVPNLLRYFDPAYEQGLMAMQGAVDQAIRAYLENSVQAELHPKRLSWRARVLEWMTLKRVRLLISNLGLRAAAGDRARFDAEMYERVLRRGQQIAAEWGGEITIVYVPDSSRYPGAFGYSPRLRQVYDETRAKVLEIAGKRGIRVIDITARFPDLPESRSGEYAKIFYPYQAHFKPEGYRVMDAAILEELR